MRILQHKDSRQVRLGRRRFIKGCVVLAAMSAVPTGLLRKAYAGGGRHRAYRRLRILTDKDLYGPNLYAG